MAYTDLANLYTDPTFVGRVAYAVAHYATYLAGSVSANIYQITWANYATLNGASVTQSIMPSVLQDATVVVALGDITDPDLQIVVETACNALIAAQTPYQVLYQFAIGPVFLARLQVAVVTFAEYVIKEAPDTPSHSIRYAWAKTAMAQQAFVSQQIAMGTAQDPTISAKLNTATDAEIQAAAEAQINILLLT